MESYPPAASASSHPGLPELTPHRLRFFRAIDVAPAEGTSDLPRANPMVRLHPPLTGPTAVQEPAMPSPWSQGHIAVDSLPPPVTLQLHWFLLLTLQ